MFKLFLITVCVIFVAGDVDWCNIEHCRPYTHVACLAERNDYGNCEGRNLVVAEITRDLEDVITDTHNEFRNQVAGGHVKGRYGEYFPQAARMATMQYSYQLEKIAEANAKSCIFAHDKCRKTPKFRSSGQNLYLSGTTNREKNSNSIADFIKKGIQAWFDEHKLTRLSDIEKFTDLYVNGEAIGHFTAIVNELQTHVGCAVSEFDDRKYRNYYLVCNYAYTNMEDSPVYAAGRAASHCSTGHHHVYRHLCSTDEQYAF